MMENYSLSDIRAVTDGNNMDGFGGGNWMWAIILFLFFFNGNNAGFGGRDATAAAQQEILLGQQFEGVNNKLNDISNGLCNGFYALNNSVMNEGRGIQTQLADCCCDTRLGIANVNANIDKQTCAITTAIHAENEATRAMIRENEIQTLRDKVADLQLKSSQCDQNAYLINQLKPCPSPAYFVPNPNCCYNPCGCGYGCGQANI